MVCGSLGVILPKARSLLWALSPRARDLFPYPRAEIGADVHFLKSLWFQDTAWVRRRPGWRIRDL